MGTGQEFVKKIRPVGAAFFLFMLVAYLCICFFSPVPPVNGYIPPQTDGYYAEHIDELTGELRSNLIPALGYEGVSVETGDGRVVITAPETDLDALRQDILYYYGEDLFEFAGRGA